MGPCGTLEILLQPVVLLLAHTVRDNLFRMSPNFGQHPPFFSKMRTFFKNRPPWYKFYSNSPLYHGGRFLAHPKTKKVFFSVGIFSQIGRCRWIICIGFSYTPCLHTVPIQNWRFSNAHNFVKNLVWHSFYSAF